MRQRLSILVLLGVLAVSGVARADRIAYVDVTVHGDLDAEAAHQHLRDAFVNSGYQVRFAADGSQPCGPDATCLAARAQKVGADLAAHATFLLLAKQVSVALYLLEVRSKQPSKFTHHDVALGAKISQLAHWLKMTTSTRTTELSGHRVAAWSLVGGSVALGLAGALSLARAGRIEDDFVANHINAQGQVHSISRARAEALEQKAQNFTAAGWILLGAAVGTSTGAVVLFVYEPNESGSAMGVGLSGSF